MASGVNRNRAAPASSNTGTNTMQMASVETNAGTAICDAPSSTDRTMGLRMAMLRCVFSSSTVASSTRMPTASAEPPRVIALIVSPNRFSTISEVRIDSGMEMQTIIVLRQLPRNNRIIRPVSSAAVAPSLTTPLMALRTKIDWSNSERTLSSFGNPARIFGSSAFTLSTMSSVEAWPLRITVSSAPRVPSWRTMLACTAKPSRTWATSPR